jgi:hypothetical protein
MRQRLLILYSAEADLASQVVGWSEYDATRDSVPETGQQSRPPYQSVFAAMRDGWRVVQLPQLVAPRPDDPYSGAHLKNEYVLEKLEENHS